MKLISLLNKMDEDETIEVCDECAPIGTYQLFCGTVGACKTHGYFRNGIVTAITAENGLSVLVNIEYQKK